MEEYHDYLELLELSQDSTPADICRRYRYLKNLYSGDSIEIRALNNDFSEEIRADFLLRLDDAFKKLNELSEKSRDGATRPRTDQDDELRLWLTQIDCFTGSILRSIRERMKVELKTVFAATRIQTHFLEDIEGEVFESFPAEVYLRSYLIEYARFLSLDTQRVLNDYLPRYRGRAAK
ncbi:MAG: helix-turn-helix domain-containing protein [Trichlorobacter sp.]|uniref:helix-turn-helix domain-containing protein n=1 Tax=Trichlorobacter sp. TaxID=2911007 RepID=UPI00255FE4C0|nr:helix-turn-helix domain-containing protein [Trichlorobacter sp.]MDK9719082.1 helix-turn-helix domain-containing protein [Trichlorobacter sp.]